MILKNKFPTKDLFLVHSQNKLSSISHVSHANTLMKSLKFLLSATAMYLPSFENSNPLHDKKMEEKIIYDLSEFEQYFSYTLK